MTDIEAQTFVNNFAAAWAARDGDAFLALWHPEGKLHYPFANRVIEGSEIGKLNDLTNARAPRLTWKLVDWTSRGDVVVIEWEIIEQIRRASDCLARRRQAELRDGKIIEEIVDDDTAPLRRCACK